MSRLIHGTWSGGARLVSLSHQTVQEGWDFVQATWYHYGSSVRSVRESYPRFSAITVSGARGFVIVEADVRPARLPGVVAANIKAAGAFAPRIFRGGAALVHNENPTGVRFIGYGVAVNAVWDKTDILLCEPTLEVVVLDDERPETESVGSIVVTDITGEAMPAVPPSPVTPPPPGGANTALTIHWPAGWVLQGIEYQQLGVVFLKRYMYGYRHKFTF